MSMRFIPVKATLSLALVAGALLILSGFKTHSTEKALAFINSLKPAQQSQLMHDFNDMTRTNWTYLPATVVPHSGLKLGDLNDSQKGFFEDLLKVFVSEQGIKKTYEIIQLENVLYALEGNNPMRDAGAYYIAFYGNPAPTGAWGWSFEGHHISLNFTIVNNQITVAPRFLGSNPAEVRSGDLSGLRVLHAEEDLGLELINALSPEQRQQAIFQTGSFHGHRHSQQFGGQCPGPGRNWLRFNGSLPATAAQ